MIFSNLKLKTCNILAFIFLLISIGHLQAQNVESINNPFVRVYDSNGQKITKGRLVYVSDTLLSIDKNDKIIKLNVNDIYKIKTKRSVGNNILVGSIIGGTTLTLIGALSAEEETKEVPSIFGGTYETTVGETAGEGAAYGAAIGFPSGALVGLISSVFKNSKTFIINGDTENLKVFIDYINKN